MEQLELTGKGMRLVVEGDLSLTALESTETVDSLLPRYCHV